MNSEETRPLAYRQGWQDFYGRKFVVDERVLIPRPETEMMVDAVLGLAGKVYLPGVKPTERVLPERPVIWDVGTGSGCVAITLALELPEAEVMGLDISSGALEVAQENARRLGATGVRFVRSDLLGWYRGESSNGARRLTPKELDDNRGEAAVEPPDCIVANLPYVSRDWDWTSPELKYEPNTALFAEDEGLELIKRLIAQVAELGSQNGKPRWLVIEADPCQHAKVKKYAESHGFACHEIRGYQVVLVRG